MSVSFDRNGSWPDRPLLRIARFDQNRQEFLDSRMPIARLATRAAVAGTGSYLPERVLSNADLSKLVDTTDEWIFERTGIRERRIVGDNEGTTTMATEAARRACADAGIDPAELDLIIVATLSPDFLMPATACLVQHAIGAKSAGAFDIEAACSGFVFASSIANAFIASGTYENVLVIGAETLSRFVDYTDRGSCILFGDGAGAVVYTARRDGAGMQFVSMRADGSQPELLYLANAAMDAPGTHPGVNVTTKYIYLAGRQVAKFATKIMVETIEEALVASGLTTDELTLLVPHQVNERIIDAALKRVGLPREKCFVNIDRYGNTSAASVPIALDEARRQGRLKPGDTAMMVGFGAGLTWGASVIKM